MLSSPLDPVSSAIARPSIMPPATPPLPRRRPLRILMCHNAYRQHGGEDNVFQLQRRILEEGGEEVRTYGRSSGEIDDFGPLARLRMVLGGFFSWRSYREVRSLAREFEPDLAVVQNVFPLLSPSVYVALRRQGVPTVQMVYNYRLHCANAQLFTQGKLCERCLHGSTLNAARFKCLHGRRLRSLWYGLILGLHRRLGTFRHIERFVVPHAFVGAKLAEGGLPAERFRESPNAFLLPDPVIGEAEPPFVLYVGRVIPAKGVFTLVRAMEGVEPPVRLVVVGDGEDLPRIEAYLAERPALARRVELLGPRWGSEVETLMARMMAMVLPSEWYDVSPTTVYTALALGKPALVTSLGSCPQIVDDGVEGLVFEAGNPRHLAAQINRLAADPELRRAIGRRARQKAERELTPQAYYQRMQTIFSEVVAKAG
jgi:glycosyltransferase involved in cell wall biosynthesis